MNRACQLPALGDVDEQAGEFWVKNPFEMPKRGDTLSAFERTRMFLNRPGQPFLDVSFASGADIDSDSRSVIAADFDGDAAIDLLVGSVGGGPVRLFRNRLDQGSRVRIELVGTNSNVAGIGSRVTLTCGSRRIIRDAFPANGFMGSGSADLLIGLGAASRIDTLTVRWPDGHTQQFRDLPTDTRITIKEDQATPEVAPLTGTGASRF